MKLFERKNKKEKIKNYKVHKINVTIIIILLISVCLPFFLEFFVWRNTFQSAITNSDWSSFLGSYLGGIIGGLATLLTLRFTLLETKNEHYKDFLTKIIDIIALFLDDVRKLKVELKAGKLLNNEICELQNEIKKIQEDRNFRVAPNNIIKENLDKVLQEKKNEIDKRQNRKNDIIQKLQLIENSMRHNYIVLDINLRDVQIGLELLVKMEEILKLTLKVLDSKLECYNYEECLEQLKEEDINSKTTDFIVAYKRKYLL